MTYRPQPIDTSNTILPEGLEGLEEQLAKHNHDIWAEQRIHEGWKYGPQRDDDKKEHPCLVPYEELPESEKEYDRRTSAEALKAILTKGYRIESPEVRATEGPESPSAVTQLLSAIDRSGTDSAGLMGLWQDRHHRLLDWEPSPEPYRLLSRKLLSIGAPLVALEVISEGLLGWENDLPLRQLKGLALARTGAPRTANRILQAVRQELENQSTYVEPALLEETLGLLARTHKDLGLTALDPDRRRDHLRQSLELYHNAYRRTGRYWTGINVATLATLLGEMELAQTTAREVRERCLADLEELPETDPGRYWALATLGEAELNLGDLQAAEARYREAAAAGKGRYGDLNSTRRQCRLILKEKQPGADLANDWLPVPGVAVFSGHMIDQPGREEERFPARFADAVKRTIKSWLKEHNVRIGFSSAACGSDILFQEALKELDGECHVVLPYEDKQFMQDSVNITGGEEWGERFQKVLKHATQTVYTSGQKIATGSVSYDYANLVLHGLATVRAHELETEPTGLVVWNGQPGDGPGGTASVVARWHGLGVPVWKIDLSHLPETVPESLPIVIDERESWENLRGQRTESDTKVMAMLFADAVNFGRLTEEQVPKFVNFFMGEIADIVRKYAEGNVVRNTWGDGLYLVFKTVRDAAFCALEMREMVQATDWQSKGLPKELTLRIALHAGPVFEGIDPVTGNKNYTGTHVSRAARLEPKTPPGEVYASEAFAALVAVDQVDPTAEFSCEYIKQLEWAKHYGTFPTYVVRKGPKLRFDQARPSQARSTDDLGT